MNDVILLRAENTGVEAILSSTAAARDFKRRLPLTVSGTRSNDNYRCRAAIGCFDPEETQTGWRNGDISIAGGWLRIFFDGEGSSGDIAGIMVIAHIGEGDLELIRRLPVNVRFCIEAADDNVRTP